MIAARRQALALAALLCGAAAPARADVGPDSEWYLLSGINAGAVIEDAVAELMLGAEVSAARLFRHGAWYGAYVDGVRDFRRDSTRFSLGFEAGYSLIGGDIGPVIELDDQTRTGMRFRVVFTGAWFTAYGGPVIRFGDMGEEERLTGEVGVLVKFPLPLQGGHLSPTR
jgi:hypothetical protein